MHVGILCTQSILAQIHTFEYIFSLHCMNMFEVSRMLCCVRRFLKDLTAQRTGNVLCEGMYFQECLQTRFRIQFHLFQDLRNS